MRYICDVSYPKACFPVRAVNKGSAIAWVFGVFTWPSLYSHVVNVNPATTGCFPSDFVFSDLDDGVTNTRCRNARKGARSASLKVEVSDGHTTAGFTQSRIALLVIRVGYENVPFSIDHVRVEVVRTTWMVDVVP